MPSTPYMNLDLPSPLVTLGPTWATLLNAAFGEVDAHDHTSGNGLPIRPAAMLFDEPVNLNGQPLQNLQSIALQSLAAAATGTTTIYALNGDLYFRNGNDVPIAITVGNAIAGAPGSITNLPAGNAVYEAANRWIRFFFDASSMAGLDVAFLTMRQNESRTGPTFSLTMPTTGMTTNIAWKMPVDLPTAPQNYGIVAARIATATTAALEYQVFDDATIESVIVGGKYTIRVKNDGITNAKILEGAVTGGIGGGGGITPTGSIAYRTIVTENLAQNAVTAAKLGLGSVIGGITGLDTPVGALAFETVATGNIANNAITSAKIAVGAVTGGVTGGLADGPLAVETVATGNIAPLAITVAKIANLAVETAKIADGAVTPSKRARVYGEGYYTAPSAIPINLSNAYLAMTRTAVETADLTFNRPVTITIQPFAGGGTGIYDFAIENQNFGGGTKTAVVEVILRNAASILRIFRTSVVIKGNFIESIQPMTFVHYPQNNYAGCFVDLLVRGDGTDLWLYSFANVWWSISQ